MYRILDKIKTPARGLARISFGVKLFAYIYVTILFSLFKYLNNLYDQVTVILSIIFFLSPIISYYLIRYFNNDLRVGTITLFFDTFFLGLSCAYLHFPLVTMVVFFAAGTANIVAFNGLKKLYMPVISFFAGMVFWQVFFYSPVDLKSTVEVNIGTMLFVLIYFSFFAYAAYKTSVGYKKARNQFMKRNLEIENSILFAEKIQSSVFRREEIQKKFSDTYFIWFRPKDVVSGDFYWIYEKKEFLYVAVGDCTGHGVPGGLLSMLGTSFLNEIASQEEIISPADMLQQLKDKIIKELTGSDEMLQDGMDISLLKLNLLTNEMEWSGAYNPLYIIRRENRIHQEDIENESVDIKLDVVKGDRLPIGYTQKKGTFTNHILQMNGGDLVYLFSDGFADQFGGPKGNKIGYAKFREMLYKTSCLPMSQQKQKLIDGFQNWKTYDNKSWDQIDDICVIGIKI